MRLRFRQVIFALIVITSLLLLSRFQRKIRTISYSQTLIPLLIHQTYKTNNLNEIACFKRTWISTWLYLNPLYRHSIYNDSQMNDIASTFGLQIYNAFLKLPLTVQRTDLFRYMVLYKYGGTYADIDTSCLRPINDWTTSPSTSVILGLEWNFQYLNNIERRLMLQQWTMSSVKGHYLFLNVLQSISKDIESKDFDYLNDAKNVVHLTGPFAFTRVVKRVLIENGTSLDKLIDKKEPLLFNDILIYPDTGFNYFNNDDPGNVQPLIRHHFSGEWKNSAKILTKLRLFVAQYLCIWVE